MLILRTVLNHNRTWFTHKNLVLGSGFLKRVTSSTVPISKFHSLTSGISTHSRRLVGLWLASCAGACFGAVLLGGLTRLTESGLSMTDWHLWKERPPFSQQEWLVEFEKYKKFPEFQYRNSETDPLSLSHFKFIWWMEYAHRTWGRCIGVLFLFPATWLWARGHFSTAMKRRVPIYGALLLGQGLLGWYMVRSGLHHDTLTRDVPSVSQYRLAAHLGSAIVLYSGFLWAALAHLLPTTTISHVVPTRSLIFASHAVLTLVFTTALSGAFVAGLDAGLVYNSWPKMANRWIPEDLATLTPLWRNVFENVTTVQFDHRLLGHSSAVAVALLWWRCTRQPMVAALPRRVQLAAHCLLGAVLLQVTLGITTLLTYVPTPLASSHQGGSLVVLSCALWLIQELKRLPK